jgi:hypothetical protein
MRLRIHTCAFLYNVQAISREAPGTSGSGEERQRERVVSGALQARTDLLRSVQNLRKIYVEQEIRESAVTATYTPGDLVEYLPTGEHLTIHEHFTGSPYRPPHVGMFRVTGDAKRVHAMDVYTHPDNVRLITRAGERTMFPGDGWSHELFATTPDPIREVT